MSIDLPVMLGYTLIELVAVLTLFAVGASAFAPTARRLGDRAAVVSVREEIVRALARARSAAVASGGGSITLVARPPSVRIETGSVVLRRLPIAYDAGVTIELNAGRDSTTLRFDRLGIGRFANGTVTIRRGEAVASLVVSSYGRVRRR